jgi:hypothetical protein
MKRKHGGFLPGRSSGRFIAKTRSAHATVADSVGDKFQPRYIPEEVVSPNFASPIYRPMPPADGQSYRTGLSQDIIIKIEVKRLINKYPQYCPEGLMQWAILCCNNGDNRILDDKLGQLRTIDSRLNRWESPFSVF